MSEPTPRLSITETWPNHDPRPDGTGNVTLAWDEYARAAACVNALRGCPDPAKLIEAADELFALIENDAAATEEARRRVRAYRATRGRKS